MVDLQASLQREAGRSPASADVYIYISQFENNQTGGRRSKSVGGGAALWPRFCSSPTTARHMVRPND